MFLGDIISTGSLFISCLCEEGHARHLNFLLLTCVQVHAENELMSMLMQA